LATWHEQTRDAPRAVESELLRRVFGVFFDALLSAEAHVRCAMPEMKAGVRALPRVVIDGVEYFVDERLGELRRCDNPPERICFGDLD